MNSLNVFKEIDDYFDAKVHDKHTYVYGRVQNPTVRILEDKVAALVGDFAVLQTTNEVIANSNTPSAGVYLMNFCLFIPLLIYAIFLLRKDVSL